MPSSSRRAARSCAAPACSAWPASYGNRTVWIVMAYKVVASIVMVYTAMACYVLYSHGAANRTVPLKDDFLVLVP